MTGNTVQVDYANPLSEHHKIEAGLKHIYRNSTSDTDNKQSDEYGTFPIEKIKFTGMDYRQHVLGIYAGYGFTYTKWSGRLGARMERTWNDADVEETAKGTYSFSNRQFNVVPYLSLTFIPKVSHNISLSYTQRLQRPGIYMLSPAEDDTDPTRLSYGNPGLEAAVYHTINLQYGHYAAKWSMTFALNTFLSNNNMSSYSFSDGDGITNTTYSNDVRSRSYGFNGSFSYRPSEKVNLSLSYNGRYSQNDFDAMDIHTDQFTFSQNLNLDFALWKEARLMLGENYSTGYAWLGGKSESYYYYYMGIKQQFLKKKLDLSIMCNNPFEKYRRNRSTSDTPTFGGWSEYRYACRSLYFRVSYRFGKQNVGVKRTAKSNPQRRHEQRRTGRWRRKHRRRTGRRRDDIPADDPARYAGRPASPRGPSSQESSRKSFQESSRHLRGIYAAVFPLLQGTTHTASGRGIHIDEKGLPHKQPETEIPPAGVCSGGGEIVKSDLPDSPSVICSLPCSALPGTPGAVIG